MRDQVAERMSKTIGLPASSVNSLMAEFSDADIERLHGLDDAAFKQESVKLVNEAQQRQFAKIGQAQPKADAAPADTASAAISPQREQKKLVISMSPSDEKPPPPQPKGLAVPTQPGSSGIVVPAAEEAKPKKPAITIDLGESSSVIAPAATPTVSAAQPPAAQPPADPGGGKKLQINMNAVQANKDAVQTAADSVARVAAQPPAQPPAATIQAASDDVPTGTGGAGASPISAAAEPPNRVASGIQAVEPEKTGPLNISAQEKQLLEDEVPKMVRSADLPSEGESKEVSSAFTSKNDNSQDLLSKKNMPLLIGAGVGGLVVIAFLIFFAFKLLFPATTPVDTPPPKKNNKVVKKDDDTDPGAGAVKGFVGKWAWKHTKSFKQKFKNEYLLSGRKGTSFTIEMWFSIQNHRGVKSMTLSASNNRFILGVITQFNKPFVTFDVPEASFGSYGAQMPMPEGSGWIHLAGVYDPVDNKSLTLYLNGKKVKTKPVTKDIPLPASMFTIQGEITSDDSAVLIDDVRMTRGIVYTKSFKPERNLGYNKTTAALLQMEKKQVGENLYEVINVADDKKTPARFTSGEFVEVDTTDFKIAVERAVELQQLMFAAYKERLSPKKYQAFLKMWSKAPKAAKEEQLKKFELKLEQEKKKNKAPEGEGTNTP